MDPNIHSHYHYHHIHHLNSSFELLLLDLSTCCCIREGLYMTTFFIFREVALIQQCYSTSNTPT